MRTSPLNTPILLCIFNRPSVTRRVFQAIAEHRPRHLFVASDGPRASRPGEAELVEQARRVIDAVDWDCELKTDFCEANLGCRARMNRAIDWAFSYHDELIILEDDCLPGDAFFEFCRELLDRYREDPRVWMISGDNFQPGPRTPYSYYFSRWAHIWGWATWRRAWRNGHDPEMRDWWRFRETDWIESLGLPNGAPAHWRQQFDLQASGGIDTWDFAWQYSIWRNGGCVVLPERNLISNLGFAGDATHTRDATSWLANLPIEPLGPMRHPPSVQLHPAADRYTWETVFQPKAEKYRVRTSRRSKLWKSFWGKWRQRQPDCDAA